VCLDICVASRRSSLDGGSEQQNVVGRSSQQRKWQRLAIRRRARFGSLISSRRCNFAPLSANAVFVFVFVCFVFLQRDKHERDRSRDRRHHHHHRHHHSRDESNDNNDNNNASTDNSSNNKDDSSRRSKKRDNEDAAADGDGKASRKVRVTADADEPRASKQ
jgi:hypothetical protein